MNEMSSNFQDKFAVSSPYAYFLRSKVLQMNIYQGNGPQWLRAASMVFCAVLRVSSQLSSRMILFNAKQMFLRTPVFG